MEKRGWFRRHRHKIGVIAIGHTAKKIEEYVVDWALYGVLVAYCSSVYGPIYGPLVVFALMFPFTGILCLVYIKLYDWAQVDMFGLEALKELREEQQHSGWFGRFIYRIAKHGGLAAFFALSIYSDAFLTTVYMRKSEHAYRGLRRRDGLIFWSSLFVSNAYWTLRWAIIIEVARFLWRIFVS